MNVALIVEGHGDAAAFPSLVVKAAAIANVHIIAANPIRAGGVDRLRKAGEVERYATLAARRPNTDLVLIALDLDDECAVEVKSEFEDRLKVIEVATGIPVRVVFCVREYECWFLSDINNLKENTPEYGWIDGFDCDNPDKKRDAKGYLNSGMVRHYKETVDQPALTKKLDLCFLYNSSRSFRRFVKALTNMDYEELGAMFC